LSRTGGMNSLIGYSDANIYEIPQVPDLVITIGEISEKGAIQGLVKYCFDAVGKAQIGEH